MEELDNITLRALSNTSFAIVISDTSIKNHVATSISHIHLHNRPVTKTIHRMVNVFTTEAELFAIWCDINQAVSITNVNHIAIITDSLHAAKRIFNSSSHPYQIHSAAILSELKEFFSRNTKNCIEFWDCPSKQKWPLHMSVEEDSKSFESILSFFYKSSWDYYGKRESDLAILQCRIYFQVANSKKKSFLDLLDDNHNPIEPSNVKGGPWLQYFSMLNLLCAKATRAIINNALIGKYRLRFFSRKDFSCLCSMYPIETRRHILYECSRFNKY